MIQTILISSAVLLRIISNPLGNVFQKQLTQRNFHPLLINFLTYATLSVASLFLVAGTRRAALPFQFWIYAVLGGIAGALGNGFLIKALQKGDLSVLGPVNSYKSVVGMIVGFFLLMEVPGLWGLLGIALIIYGSYFVLDTTDDRFTMALLKRTEIRYRIWAMILTAIEAVFVKKVILASSAMLAFAGWCWFGAFFSFFFLLLNKPDLKAELRNIKSPDVLIFVYLVLCIGFMQLTTNYVFNHMPVGYALSLFQLSTIISVLLGYRFFQEQNIRKKLLGSLIMIAGSVLIIHSGNS